MPLARRLEEMLLAQMHRCSDAGLGSAARSISLLFIYKWFPRSNVLLAALDAELLSRFERKPWTPVSAPALCVDVLDLFRNCTWPASDALQWRAASWLLGAPTASERSPAHVRGAQALNPRRAEKLLRAWVYFAAAASGAPAQETLPAVLQALDGPLAAHLKQLGGAAGVLERALTDQLMSAPCVEVHPLALHTLSAACLLRRSHFRFCLRMLAEHVAVVSHECPLACNRIIADLSGVQAVAQIWERLGSHFTCTSACAAISRLAHLCAPYTPYPTLHTLSY